MNLVAALRSVNQTIISAVRRLTVHLNGVIFEHVCELLGMNLLLVLYEQDNLVVVLGRHDTTIKRLATLKTPKLRKLCSV